MNLKKLAEDAKAVVEFIKKQNLNSVPLVSRVDLNYQFKVSADYRKTQRLSTLILNLLQNGWIQHCSNGESTQVFYWCSKKVLPDFKAVNLPKQLTQRPVEYPDLYAMALDPKANFDVELATTTPPPTTTLPPPPTTTKPPEPERKIHQIDAKAVDDETVQQLEAAMQEASPPAPGLLLEPADPSQDLRAVISVAINPDPEAVEAIKAAFKAADTGDTGKIVAAEPEGKWDCPAGTQRGTVSTFPSSGPYVSEEDEPENGADEEAQDQPEQVSGNRLHDLLIHKERKAMKANDQGFELKSSVAGERLFQQLRAVYPNSQSHRRKYKNNYVVLKLLMALDGNSLESLNRAVRHFGLTERAFANALIDMQGNQIEYSLDNDTIKLGEFAQRYVDEYEYDRLETDFRAVSTLATLTGAGSVHSVTYKNAAHDVAEIVRGLPHHVQFQLKDLLRW